MAWNIINFKNAAVALLLIIMMLTCSIVLGEKDVLFPEIAGMAMGVMAFSVVDWIKKPVHLWLSPSFAAFLGTALNDLTISPLFKLWLCLIIIVVLMHVFRVHFSPTIPAGMLPFFLGIHDYVFAITTTIFTFIIMIGAFYKKKHLPKLPDAPQGFRKIFDTIIVSILLCLWIGLAYAAKIQVFLVPPAFVLIFELFHAPKFVWRKIAVPLTVMTLTSVFSVAVYHLFSGSIILVGIINVLITLLLCRFFKAPLPASFGIALMPLIFPAWGTWWFPIGVLITTGVFMCLAAVYRGIRTKQTLVVQTQINTLDES